MIKFNGGFRTEREAHLLGFGLSEANLVRLLDNEPIIIHANEVGLTKPGSPDFLIFAGNDKAEIELRAKTLIEVITEGQPSQEISCLHIDNKFFVIPVAGTRGKNLYLVGLDSESYQVLREGKILSFRARCTDTRGVNVEAVIFWGENEQAMETSLREQGVIGPNTQLLNPLVTQKLNP